MAKNHGVYIKRDSIRDFILKICSTKWTEFEVAELEEKGNAMRCHIIADGTEADLDFYFRKDGSTTIRPTGQNTEISSFVS